MQANDDDFQHAPSEEGSDALSGVESTAQGDGGVGANSHQEAVNTVMKLASKEKNQIRAWKLLFVLAILVVGVSVSLSCYFLLREKESAAFRKEVRTRSYSIDPHDHFLNIFFDDGFIVSAFCVDRRRCLRISYKQFEWCYGANGDPAHSRCPGQELDVADGRLDLI
jgi:hypothetical protein